MMTPPALSGPPQSDGGVLLNECGVLVTRDLVRYGGTTLAVRQINTLDITAQQVRPSGSWHSAALSVCVMAGTTLLFLGIAIPYAETLGTPIGQSMWWYIPAGIASLIGVIPIERQRRQRVATLTRTCIHVSAVTSVGRVQLISTFDHGFATRLHAALEQAIACR